MGKAKQTTPGTRSPRDDLRAEAPFRLLAVDPSSRRVGWSLWEVDATGHVAYVDSGQSDDGHHSTAIRTLASSCKVAVFETQFIGANISSGFAIFEARVRLQQRCEDAGCKIVLVSNMTWQNDLLVEKGEKFVIPGKPARPAKPPKPGKRKGTPAREATPDRVTSRAPTDVLKARSRLLAQRWLPAGAGEDQADATCIGWWATRQIVGGV